MKSNCAIVTIVTTLVVSVVASAAEQLNAQPHVILSNEAVLTSVVSDSVAGLVLNEERQEWSTARGSEFDSFAPCYKPVKYQKSGCCEQATCQTFGCLVNKGVLDRNTPCDPTGGYTGTPSWVFCADNGCKDSHTCSNCWCGELGSDHLALVAYDLSHHTLYYAFTTEWLVTAAGCVDCFNAGDIDAFKEFMEKQLQPDKCLPHFDGKAHNGMRCASDNDCKSGRCSKGFSCEDKLPNGRSCGEDDDCVSGRCDKYFLCQNKLGKGKYCWNNDDCQSNRCSWDWWSGFNTCA